MDAGFVNFIAGAIVGVILAGVIGRAKFLKVQLALRAAEARAQLYLNRLEDELNKMGSSRKKSTRTKS